MRVLRCVLVLVVAASVCHGQPVLRVATKVFHPFSFLDNGAWKGYSIDFMERVASDMGRTIEWIATPTITTLLATVKNDTGTVAADCAIAGITITAAREEQMDFSHKYYSSGLQVMVPFKSSSSFDGFVKTLFSPFFYVTCMSLLTLLLASANCIWLAEHRVNPEELRPHYHRGAWDGFWYATVTVTTAGYGDKTPKSFAGQLVGVVTMWVGLVLVSFFIGSVTTALTVGSLTHPIGGVEDLVNVKTAVVEGSSAATTLRETVAAKLVYFANDRLVLSAVKNQDVDAGVHDAPNLLFLASTEGAGEVTVVGDMFAPQPYGIAFPLGTSDLKEEMNRIILKYSEGGVFDVLDNKWFSVVPNDSSVAGLSIPAALMITVGVVTSLCLIFTLLVCAYDKTTYVEPVHELSLDDEEKDQRPIYLKRGEPVPEEMVETAKFEFEKHENDGNIDAIGLVTLARALGTILTHDQAIEKISDADQDGDGHLDFDEFVPLLGWRVLDHDLTTIVRKAAKRVDKSRNAGFWALSLARNDVDTVEELQKAISLHFTNFDVGLSRVAFDAIKAELSAPARASTITMLSSHGIEASEVELDVEMTDLRTAPLPPAGSAV